MENRVEMVFLDFLEFLGFLDFLVLRCLWMS